MYQLTSAIAKPLVGDARWISVDIGSVPMNVLYSTYSRIWAVLTNVFLPAPVALDLELIRAEHGGKSITLNELLVSLGDQALPTVQKVPVLKPRYAKYQDVFRAGYKVTPIHPSYAIDAPVPEADKTWLHLTRPELDHQLFYQKCLVNVNGFYHLTDASKDAVYVVDGMKSARISGENQIGFVSFASLGKLSFVPIKKEMIYKQKPEQQFNDCAYVDLGQDVTDKTVMLVLGGYLHAVDPKTFRRVGESTFMIDFGNLPLLERYFDSKRYIDLSSLGLTKTDRNVDQVSVNELFSDAVIEAYLTLSQSFFVILDNNDIFAEQIPLMKSRIPNLFLSDEAPFYPIITGVGRTANFWTKFEHGKWALFATDNLRDRPLYRTIDPTVVNSVSNQREPASPVYYTSAFHLKIGTDLS